MKHFVFRLWPTVITGLMLAVLLGLGTWQVQRLHWKENLIATIHARMQEAPVDVASLPIDVTDLEYRPIKAIGLFQHDKEMYLASISLSGEGGWHVLTPLQLDDGNWLLVDRGWVPYDRKGVGIGGADFMRPIGPVTARGVLRLSHHHWMQATDHPERNEWYGYNLPAMAKATDVPKYLPYVLEASTYPPKSGYPLGGQTHVDLPNHHLEYAITWYALALALIVIYGVSGYRKLS